MCGIAGIVGRDLASRQPALAGMVERLRHRGPDDSGSFASTQCLLGHARLSIIDLATGHQPLENEDASLQLVCNGEIYNFRELRAALESRGHRFQTNSDNEVILHLYEERGADCVKDLDGMFAFALWDAKAERLLLARDRIGEKPLVYYHGNGIFAFASELASLLALDGVPRVLDPAALHHYLSYLAVPFPLTIYQGVRKLPPAHILVLERGNVRIERYWDVAPTHEHLTMDDAAEQVRTVVEEAVRSRLVADVPLGAFLSGGIDSSIIVGLMSKLGGEVRTFTIGFGDRDYDELDYARAAAEEFHTVHTEFQVTPDAVSVLPLLARRFGEPFADPSAIPTYYLAQKTVEHVKVALTGDGADESFGGYPRHVAARACGQVDRLAPSIGKLVGVLGAHLPTGKDRKSSLTRARLLLGAMHLSPARRHAAWLAYYSSEAEKRRLYTPALMEATAGLHSADAFVEEYARCEAIRDPATAAMYVDLVKYLPNDPLVKTDIATMANGLETRAPLLDQRVIELAFRIPSHLKIHSGLGKYVLRHAFRDLLPEKIVSRGKMGFGVPIARWLREDLASYATDTLLGSETIFPKVFERDHVARLLREHTSGVADRAYPIWTLLCFELWAREFQPRLPF